MWRGLISYFWQWCSAGFCLNLMFFVYRIVRFSLLFFVKKMDRAHEVAITIISAFFFFSLTNVTNDYICTQQLKPDGSGVNIHCHHIVFGVKDFFLFSHWRNMFAQTFWIVSIWTPDPLSFELDRWVSHISRGNWSQLFDALCCHFYSCFQ